MKNRLFNALNASPAWRQALDAIRLGRTAAIYDTTESQRAFLAAALATETGRQVLYVAPSEQAAMRAAEDCASLLDSRAGLMPAQEMVFLRAVKSRESAWERLTALDKVITGEYRVLCVSADVLLTRLMPPDVYAAAAVTLQLGDDMEPHALAARLAASGYERVDMVEGKGQFAIRGDILDVFPPCEADAMRIGYFDTQIDAIRTFDILTQRSKGTLSQARLTPAVEYFVLPALRAHAAESMRSALQTMQDVMASGTLIPHATDEDNLPEEEATGALRRLLQDADALEDEGFFSGIHMWANVVLPDSAPLYRWMDNPILLIDTPDRVRARMDDRALGFAADLELALTRQEATPAQAGLYYNADDLLGDAGASCAVITLQDLLRGQAGFAPDNALQLTGTGLSQYKSRFKELADDIRSWLADGWQVALLASGAARADRIRHALGEFGCIIPDKNQENLNHPLLMTAPFSAGFIAGDAKLAVITDGDIFGVSHRKTRARHHAGERIEAFTDLNTGDYVVHEHHGIGIYHGVVRLQSEGTFRDYLYIQYRGNDKLYVPVDQFDRVQKYIGSGGDAPPLNDLGGNEWSRQKKKVKAGLKKLAIDLVALYAARQEAPGFAYIPYPPWENQFAESFEYELTPDQEQAVQDVLSDMAKPIAMDRLLCGDVGYGKTEVAMRAALRATLNSRQVALLAPTTILVQQHYHTLSKRFAQFPIRVDFVSRFRTAAQNRETLAKVQAGEVDILIGTHRLLSNDVKFKNLGLLIVDEEQRFGVAHKEKIKSLKHTIDVLTLSATPIPRTLHMSMLGVRDMSLLETPPEERFPVQTYVVDYHDAMIRDAIMRELGRGGQVFFLYNRVADIDRFATRLRLIVPEARIAVAHGQMRETALEDIMMDFYAGEYNVLLCTTIIENGIDVPSANTLIVYDADRFGLAQLYQLRGRVGRSNRVAYAYFTVRPDKLLTETAEKRLAAIREFTEFGAGFRIAMRDLEIRGAGNILGPEQSGQVSAVGYDMYCKLIEEAVREAKGDFSHQKERELETRVELAVSAFLPDSYVRGEAQRMEIYKRIAMIASEADRVALTDDLVDRFGEPPEPVVNLMNVAQLRSLARGIGADFVAASDGFLKFRLNGDYVDDPALLVSALAQADSRLSLAAGRNTTVMLRLPRMADQDMIAEGIRALTSVAGLMQGAGNLPLSS